MGIFGGREVCVVSGFRRGASDVFPLVGYYAALVWRVKVFQEEFSLNCFITEDGTDRLSRNVGNWIQINGA